MLAKREYAALKRLNSVVAVSEGVANAALTAGVIAHVICNGIDTGVYACSPARDQSLAQRARMEWNSSAIVVLHTGSLIERKRPLEVIHAFMASSLFQRGLLVFAGKGPLYSQCRQKAAGAHNILFLGQREDVPDLLKSADILVSNACAEGLPMALLEGCATGVRVIATCIDPHEKIRQIFPEQVTLYCGGVAGLKAALDRVGLSGAQRPIVPSAESLDAISDHRMSLQYQRFYDSLLGIRRGGLVATSTYR
jgi:glycosyltransferase involved in cell wall biosynthesis